MPIKRRPISVIYHGQKRVFIYHPRTTTERVKMQDRIHAANRHGHITNAAAEAMLARLEHTRPSKYRGRSGRIKRRRTARRRRG